MDRDVVPAASASLPAGDIPHPATQKTPTIHTQMNRGAATAATGLGKTVGQNRGAEQGILVVKFWQFAERLTVFSGHCLFG